MMRWPSTLLLAALGLVLEPPPIQRPAPTTPFQLDGVQVTGAKRYSAIEVTRISGLEVGKQVTVADLDAAAESMSRTGLFKDVRYQYVTAAARIRVTLEIEEVAWTVPVLFDNFVWLSDEQMIAALRKDVPSFDGTAPESAGFPEFLTRALHRLLATQRIDGRVEFLPHVDLETKAQQYLFSVKDPSPKVCAAHVDGASVPLERELAGPLRSLVGKDYSRFFVTRLATGTLLRMYHDRGHWRATFGAPSVTVGTAAECAGVIVTLPATEGVAYTWDHAEWSGNNILASGDLEKLLAVKRGEVASASTVDLGLRRVRDGYGRRGYVLASTAYTPLLDDSTRRARFEIRIHEGPQFRAGTFECVGLPEPEAGNLKKKWRLLPGDVYDASYTDRFWRDEVVPLQRRRAAASTSPAVETRIDEQKRIVDVRVVFK